MAISEQVKQKRKVLFELSRKAKEHRQNEIDEALSLGENSRALFWAGRTLNSIIIELFYKKNGNTEFKTFAQWKREEKKVKKGSKGFIIWGRPLGVQQEEKKEEADDESGTYFPVSYLFSNLQVE